MRLLSPPDKFVMDMLGSVTPIQHGTKIRPSQFAVPFTIQDRHLLVNILTRLVIELPEPLPLFQEPHTIVYDPTQKYIETLYYTRFLVEEKTNEPALYSRLIKTLRLLAPKPKNETNAFTIIPTTACNARCFYCYEEGVRYKSMRPEIVEKTIQHILEHSHRDERIICNWFGGEPLMGEAVIDRICEALREHGLDYGSDMISNASLFTESIVEKAVRDWKLFHVQITLDGQKDEYLRRKNYRPSSKEPYESVISAIEMLADKGVRVDIRLNADTENIEGLFHLVDELDGRFSKKELISVYPSDIYECASTTTTRYNKGQLTHLYDSIDRLMEHIHDKGLNQSMFPMRLRTHRCMADLPTGAPVISPTGGLFCCEHITDVPCLSTLNDYTKFLEGKQNFVHYDRLEKKSCRTCPLLPECTDFSSCPTKYSDCRRHALMHLRKGLLSLLALADTYATSTDNENTVTE